MADGDRSSARRSSLNLKIRAPRDFWGGLVLVAIAVIATFAGGDLSGMQGFSFGAGTAPRLFAGLLAVAGIAMTISGLLFDGPRIERFAIRGPIMVVIAILGFAATIRTLGLVVTTFVTFMIAISGSREMRLLESLIASVAMTAFCVVIFSYLLRLPFLLWPYFLY